MSKWTPETEKRCKQDYKNLKDHARSVAEFYAFLKKEAMEKLKPMADEIYKDVYHNEDNWFYSELESLKHVSACKEVSIGDTEIRLSGSFPACSRGCCGYTHVSITAPIECLYLEDYYADTEAIVTRGTEEIRLRIEKEFADMEEAERTEAEEQNKRQEAYDREEYERLKGKFTPVL